MSIQCILDFYDMGSRLKFKKNKLDRKRSLTILDTKQASL
jgi:hypothetical protein